MFMNHSVSRIGRRKASAGLGTTLPAMSSTNPTDSTRVKAKALGAWKLERTRPTATTDAQPIKRSKGKGSLDQRTDPLNPMTRAIASARVARVIALGRFFHG
jgi:hypothetical protein